MGNTLALQNTQLSSFADFHSDGFNRAGLPCLKQIVEEDRSPQTRRVKREIKRLNETTWPSAPRLEASARRNARKKKRDRLFNVDVRGTWAWVVAGAASRRRGRDQQVARRWSGRRRGVTSSRRRITFQPTVATKTCACIASLMSVFMRCYVLMLFSSYTCINYKQEYVVANRGEVCNYSISDISITIDIYWLLQFKNINHWLEYSEINTSLTE